MRPDTNHSDEHNTSTAAESSQRAPSVPASNRLARRSFLRNLGLGAALLAPGATLLSGASKALAGNEGEKKNNRLTRGDVAILQLLAAAELDDPNNPSDHIKAIAFTAGFHFGFIEQGGTSLYATLAQKVTSLEVLRILLSIGGSEIMHFQTWQDKAGNATPLTDFDPINNSSV